MIQGNMFRLNTFVIALFTSDVGIKDISGMVKTYNLCCFLVPRRGGGGTPYNGLYEEAPPERGTFFRLLGYKRVGISQVEVYKMVGKSVI